MMTHQAMNRSTKLLRFAIGGLALGLVASACAKKEPTGGTAKDTTPQAKSERGPSPGSAAEMGAPTVAIGADRVETFAGTPKTIQETDEYKVSVLIPIEAKTGVKTAARVVLTPKAGWKLNDEFPYSLEVTPPAGVKVEKTDQQKSDAVAWKQKQGAQWAVTFTPEVAGPKDFKGTFNFAVCTDATCNPYEAALAFNVDVK